MRVTMDKILVRGLKVNTIVGIFDWEREVPQRVILDLEMAADNRAAAAADDIAATIDYQAVSDRLCDFISTNQFRLIETLAEQCADILLREFAIAAVTLRVSKPEAVPAADTVCVEIMRQRDA